jgi:mevalonate kinase
MPNSKQVTRNSYNNTIQLTARAPAKLILSGEHAVLYGQPAIAMAVDRYTSTTTTWSDTPNIHFKLADLAYAKTLTIQALQRLAQQLQADYRAFLQGKCSIRDVLKRPFELLQYSVSTIIERLNLQLPKGLEIAVRSNIPLGCGMGSSAAAVISTLCAFTNFLKLEWQRADFLNFGKEIENLQHGKSSGLDLQLVTFGGCMRFQEGVAQPVRAPNTSLYIVNTGKPIVSTGECVQHVASKMQDPGLLREFGMVTDALQTALQENNLAALQAAIRANHILLARLGVVPQEVLNLISDLEHNNCAAKICGAGAISGANAGVVMIAAADDPSEIVHKHGFIVETVQVDQNGTTIV